MVSALATPEMTASKRIQYCQTTRLRRFGSRDNCREQYTELQIVIARADRVALIRRISFQRRRF